MVKWIVSFSVVVFSLGLLSPVSTYAQVSGATLSGTVTDQSGSAVPNAQITVTNVEKQTSRPVTTDSDGFYTVPNLTPGIYEVKVTATGFSTKVQSGIELTVGAKQVLNVSMAGVETNKKGFFLLHHSTRDGSWS